MLPTWSFRSLQQVDANMRFSLRASSVIATVLFCLCGSVCGEQFFSLRPIWSSGTPHSGGDGIARFIDFDRDGDLDFVTSAPDPMRWVLYQNEGGKIAKTPAWESSETTDCDHIDVLDFNQDGWMDLAATHESHCTLYLNHRGEFHESPDWETAMIANANSSSYAGKSDWRACAYGEVVSINDTSNTRPANNSPYFAINADLITCSQSATNAALVFRTNSTIGVVTLTTSRSYMIVRTMPNV